MKFEGEDGNGLVIHLERKATAPQRRYRLESLGQEIKKRTKRQLEKSQREWCGNKRKDMYRDQEAGPKDWNKFVSGSDPALR